MSEGIGNTSTIVSTVDSTSLIGQPYGFNNGMVTVNGWPVATGGYSTNVYLDTGSGTHISLGASGNGSKKRIGPKLFFSYVKSKLNKSEVKKLKARLSKLQTLVKNAEEMGQQALYEEFSKMLAMVARESEAVACGYETYINKKDVEKYMHLVTENDKAQKSVVYLKKLTDFPRAIPVNIQKIIKNTQKKGLFDELWVLYLDYTHEEVKTNKEKIRQKDPILFGKFSYDQDKFYFIADWIDEFCDLTLSKFVETLKDKEPEYQVSSVDDIDEKLIDRVKSEVKARQDRLDKTRPNNFHGLMAEEDKKTKPRKNLWQRIWDS